MLLAQAAIDLPCGVLLVGTGRQEEELKQYIENHRIKNLHRIGEIPEKQKRYCYQNALGGAEFAKKHDHLFKGVTIKPHRGGVMDDYS